MGKPEGTVESHLVKRCAEREWIQFKFTAPGRKGVPDRIVIGGGITAFIELKSDVGAPSEIQKVVIRRMREAGALVYLCHSKDEVDRALDDIAARGAQAKTPAKTT